MNNEPVAWMNRLGRLEYEQGNGFEIPLYTHPAKTEDEGKVCARCGAIAYDPVITQTAKTLTDEEILREAYYILMREQQKKASEK